jgi:hypothetical protein
MKLLKAPGVHPVYDSDQNQTRANRAQESDLLLRIISKATLESLGRGPSGSGQVISI